MTIKWRERERETERERDREMGGMKWKVSNLYI